MRVWIGNHRGGGIPGAAIRLFDWSRKGHTSIRFGAGHPEDIVYQAGFSEGFHKVQRLEIEGPVEWREITHLLTPQQRVRLLLKAEGLLGAEYDRWSIVRFLPIVRLFYAGEAFGSRERMFCSEAVAWLCAQVGLILLRKEFNRITPGDMATSPLPIDSDVI